VSSALHAAGRLLLRWETLLVVAIFGVGVWSTTLSPFFLKRANLLDLLTPYVFIGLMAFGLTFVVIAGEIDISLVANMAVSVVCFAQIFATGANVWVAGLAGLAAITLGTLAAYGGLAFVVFTSQEIASFPSDYTELGGGYISNELPVALFVLLGSALVLGLLLHASRFGRYVFAIGSNREAARFSGIPVARVRVTVFALCGLMAGVAGVVYVGYFGSARADAGTGSLLDVVTAVVLGGVDIFGGSGSMLGVLLALVLVAELRNGMQLANVAGYTQDIVIGVMLLTAIAAGNLLRAAQTGGVRPGRLFPRRREVIRHDAAETVVPPRFDPQNSKGR
jgi:rhamnose transport system permease protein